jgi:hypothetical protein
VAYLGLAQYANLQGILATCGRKSSVAGPGRDLRQRDRRGMVAGEAVLGYVLGCALQVERTMEPVNGMTVSSRCAYAAFLAVVLLGFASGEAGLAWVGEDLGEEARVEAAEKHARQETAAAQGTPTTAVAAVVGGVGAHPRTMEGAVEAAGRADVERMREAAPERRQEAEAARDAAAKVNDTHRLKNTVVLVWVALMLALAVGLCAVVLGAFVHSLLAIPGGIAAEICAALTWIAGLFRRPAPAPGEPAGRPADPSGSGALESAPVTPVHRGSFLDRLARWPVVSWFMGSSGHVGSA